MSFLELVEKRVSCRDYKKDKIDTLTIDYLMSCTALAPSAANRQPWEIILAESETVRKKLNLSYQREWFADAPLVAVFAGIKNKNWIRRHDGADYLLCDITIAASYFVLAAEEKGLGTCYIAAFEPEIVSRALDLSEDKVPLLMISAGYPSKEQSKVHDRKTIGEVFKKA